MSRPVGPQLGVELELPVVARERERRRGTRRRAARSPRRAPCARSARGRCGRAARRTSAPGNAPPKRVLTSVMPSPISRSRKTWTVHGPRHAERLDDPPAEVDQLGVGDHRALDRLAAARLDHRARDRVQAAARRGRDRQSIENSGPSIEPLHHGRLADVVDEELGLARVVGAVDRARARAPAGLDHHRDSWRPARRAAPSAATAGPGARAAGGPRTCRRSRGRSRGRGRTPAARRRPARGRAPRGRDR